MVIPKEFDECVVFVEWLTLNKIQHTHIHNEMWTTSINQKRKAKALGVSRGVPDYMCIVEGKTGFHLVFCEMKRAKKSLSQTSKEQANWVASLNMCQNVQAYICFGAIEAIKTIKRIQKI